MNIRDFEHKVEHQSDTNFDLVLIDMKELASELDNITKARRENNFDN